MNSLTATATTSTLTVPSTLYVYPSATPTPPPSTNTANTATWALSGQSYGNGSYTALSSDSYNNSFHPFFAFDATFYEGIGANGSRWNASGGGTYTTAYYASVGAGSTTNQNGPWVQIQLPGNIPLASYQMYQNDWTVAITNWLLLGSTNGTQPGI